MRIYSSCKEAVKESEREIWEFGIEVQGYSMQDKVIKGDKAFFTKELSPYAFQITQPTRDMDSFIDHFWADKYQLMISWAVQEFSERISERFYNPGDSWRVRQEIWEEFLHNGRFAYTYNERIRIQLQIIREELHNHPGTRQAIIEIHNNIIDIHNLGGGARIPCSMHYQFLIRNEKLDMIYVMRSSDFLTHFGFDNWLAIRLQQWMAQDLLIEVGRYTFFTGSLHAYYKDLEAKGIF